MDIGFEINRKNYFPLWKNKNMIIGDLGCTFNEDSEFLYKTKTICEGFYIRKLHWCDIIEDH